MGKSRHGAEGLATTQECFNNWQDPMRTVIGVMTDAYDVQ